MSKIFTKIFNLTNAAFLVCLVAAPNFVTAGTSCTSTSTHDDHLNTNAANGEDGYCLSTPNSLIFKIYEFGICTAAATPSNTSACAKLFDNSSGTDFDLSVGASLDMADSLTLQEDTYTHAYIKVSNVTKLKSVIQFSASRTDVDGNSGSYCFTDGRSLDNTYSIITCANSSGAADYSVETITFSESGFNATVPNYSAVVGTTTVVTDLYMLDSNGVLSTQESDNFAIFGNQTLSSPVSITGNTTSIDVGFSVTNGMSFGFIDAGETEGGNLCTSSSGCLYDAVFDGLKFIVSAK